jgi:D-3-phosphoglycerate dehydrogenase
VTRVLIAEPDRFSREAIVTLETVADVVRRATPQEEIGAGLEQFDVVWVRLGLRIDAEDLPANPRCGLVVSATTGLDHLDLPALASRDIRVLSLKGRREFLTQIRGTAELTIALLLALLRRLPPALDAVRAGEWNRDDFRGREIFEKTAGIVGYGRLGSIVASYLHAMGARVLACDPNVTVTEPHIEQVAGLDELLARSDIVSLHADLNDTTRGLLGPREFLRMQPGAVLINTARGELLDEAALLGALHTQRLAGAALDVLRGEPAITAEHPLVAYAATHENLLITPHLGGGTVESMPRCERFLAGLVREWIESRNATDLDP